MKTQIGRTLLSEEQILQRVKELGKQISSDYSGREITIVCVLKGAVVFLADLVRNLDVPARLDFVQVSSYGDNTESSGNLEFLQELSTDVRGKDVLIVDDIVDSGLTLQRLKSHLLAMLPASVKICVLLDRKDRRTQDVVIDYAGFEISDEFVIGYGLDFAGNYRGLRFIAALKSLS